MANGFTPGAGNGEVIWFTLAGAAGVLGWALFAEPTATPLTGRGALLLQFIHAHLGPRAFAVLLWAAAAGALVAGVAARRRRRRTNASKDAS